MRGHRSDCAIYNEPAYPKGECNCGFQLQKDLEGIIEEYGCNPGDFDLSAVAEEIIAKVLKEVKDEQAD